jgi:hypothetical protein
MTLSVLWVRIWKEDVFLMYRFDDNICRLRNFKRKILWNGNEWGKNKSNENFKTTIPSKNYDRPRKVENVESFKYLVSI